MMILVAIFSVLVVVTAAQGRYSGRPCPRIQCDAVPEGCALANYFLYYGQICPDCPLNQCDYKPCENFLCKSVPEGCGQMTFGNRPSGEECFACQIDLCEVQGKTGEEKKEEGGKRTKRQAWNNYRGGNWGRGGRRGGRGGRRGGWRGGRGGWSGGWSGDDDRRRWG